jgi:hypothetical protein
MLLSFKSLEDIDGEPSGISSARRRRAARKPILRGLSQII